MLSALIVLFLYNKNKSFFFKKLSFLLVSTFLIECLGLYMSSIKERNFIVYHWYTLFEFFIIFIMFRALIREKTYLVVSKALLLGLFVFWIFTFFEPKHLFTMRLIGSFNVAFLVFLYLRELLLSNELINYKKLLPFWVSVGFIVFYLPSIPYFSFWNFMKDKSLTPILYVLIILMNLIVSFGLIWSYRKEESY